MPQIFTSAQIERLASILMRMVNITIERPNTKIDELSLVSQEDTDLIFQLNSQELNAAESLVHESIRQDALEQPNALAVAAWDGEVTYSELDMASSTLASDLSRVGVKRGTVIPVLFEKSLWWVVAMLAILKAGGAPVALSADYPISRSQAISRQVGAKVLLTSPPLRSTAEQLDLLILVVDHNVSFTPGVDLDTSLTAELRQEQGS